MPEYVGWCVIGKLIAVALNELYECAVVPWTLEDAPESFMAEAELNSYYGGPPGNGFSSGDFYVWLCGILCIIDAEHFECWHSSPLREEEELG